MKGFRVKVIYKGLKGINEGIWSTDITLKYHVLILRTYLESMSLRLGGLNVTIRNQGISPLYRTKNSER